MQKPIQKPQEQIVEEQIQDDIELSYNEDFEQPAADESKLSL